MRKLGLVATAAILSALVMVPVTAAAQSTGFTGSWWSIDPVDGSIQHLDIQGGTSVQIRYVDEFATTCVDIGAPSNVFTGRLAGRVDGETLTATFKQASCGPVLVLKAAYHFAWTFIYDAGTDTLFGALDDGPATWYRA